MLTKLKSLGPGLLYAGAAIGVSHLVQSTKAGAHYGYILIAAIVLAHLFKYPFFVLGPRYAEATGQSLVSGFGKLGKWAIWLLLLLTLSTMFSVQAAITVVTTGLVQKAIGLTSHTAFISLTILIVCFLILRVGKFSALENLMKVIMIVLAVTTVFAFCLSFTLPCTLQAPSTKVFDISSSSDLKFLLAFVGWMPAPLDLAIWHSIWALSNTPTKHSEFDFRVGFYGTAILGICFLTLGANTMYGTDIQIATAPSKFASQLVDIFTTSMGDWSSYIILIAAFTTMFSTTLTCFDAMPKVMNHITTELGGDSYKNTHTFWQVILLTGTAIILSFYSTSMGLLVQFATIASFLTAPLLAWMSYRIVTQQPELSLWNRTEKVLSIIGIVLLSSLSILFVSTFLYH